MKVSIVGGGGLVGSMTAFALQCGGVVSSIAVVDANKDLAQGQALDLLQGASLTADQRISAGGRKFAGRLDGVVIAGVEHARYDGRLAAEGLGAHLDEADALGARQRAVFAGAAKRQDAIDALLLQPAKESLRSLRIDPIFGIDGGNEGWEDAAKRGMIKHFIVLCAYWFGTVQRARLR